MNREIDQVLRALQDKYFMFDVRAESFEQNTRMKLCLGRGQTKLCETTPQGMDYRAMDWREWLERTAQVLALELSK